MKINLDLIKNRLFSNAKVREKILRDYDVTRPVATADEFAGAVVAQFDQTPDALPLDQTIDNATVFKAAAKALGSNQRNWSTFLKTERQFAEMLCDYDPTPTHAAFSQGRLDVGRLKKCLPGITSTADATAVQAWASLLHERPNWYSGVQRLGQDLRNAASQRLGKPLSDSRLVLCLVALLSAAPAQRGTSPALIQHRQHLLGARPKLPGMGYILGSEFFRNLHWNAFKPDTHVQRLFNRWFPDGFAAVEAEVKGLQGLLGRKAQGLSIYLRYSLLGISVTPPGVSHSFTDNMVWMLGAYLEKSGKESDMQYVLSA